MRCFTNGPYLDFVSTVLSGRQATHPSDDEANYKSASTGAGTSNSYLYHHVGASTQGRSTLISLVAKTIMEDAVGGVQGRDTGTFASRLTALAATPWPLLALRSSAIVEMEELPLSANRKLPGNLDKQNKRFPT